VRASNTIMQNQPMGQGAPVYAPNWVPRPKKGYFASMSTWEKLKLGGLGVVVVVGLGFAAFMHFKANKNVVLFENSFDQPGELLLNGKSYGSLGPHQHVRLELDGGTHVVSWNSGGKKVDDGSIDVKSSKGGLGDVGYRAVYNIGGKKGLAVVTKFYGGSMKDSVSPMPEGKRVVETPYVELTKVDDVFPESVTVRKGQTFGTVTRVCHVDEEKETVGCAGW
jgi:hypothetical protein